MTPLSLPRSLNLLEPTWQTSPRVLALRGQVLALSHHWHLVASSPPSLLSQIGWQGMKRGYWKLRAIYSHLKRRFESVGKGWRSILLRDTGSMIVSDPPPNRAAVLWTILGRKSTNLTSTCILSASATSKGYQIKAQIFPMNDEISTSDWRRQLPSC